LPGKALQVALLLRFQAGLKRSNVVRFNQAQGGREMGVSESAARRAVRELEAAGLVSVRRKPGRAAEVTLSAKEQAP
jgi:predicted ArsR family transcriptional regulator